MYCFPTATMVAQTHLIVTLHVHCLSHTLNLPQQSVAGAVYAPNT